MSEKITKYLTPIVALFFATALGVTAATTIGTDIVTEGIIAATGGELTGPLTVSGTENDKSFNISAVFSEGDPIFSAGVDNDGSGSTVELTDTTAEVNTGGSMTLYANTDTEIYGADGGAWLKLLSGANPVARLEGVAVILNTDSGTDVDFVSLTSSYVEMKDDSGSMVALWEDHDPQIISSTGCVEIGATGSTVLFCGATSDAPYSCSGGSSPFGYYTDTTGSDLCYCNGTSWAPVDGSGTCNNPV